MKNQLPRVRIIDTQFVVDMAHQEFRQADNPNNRIPFRDTLDNGDHIALLYDNENKNVFKGNLSKVSMDDDVHIVTLPPLAAIDSGVGQSTGRKELYHFAQWMDARDIALGQPILPPIVTIDNTEFLIDKRIGELREVDMVHNRIPFSELRATQGNMLEFLYDPKTKNAFRGLPEELQSRPDIKHIILPPMTAVDPLSIKRSLMHITRQTGERKQSEELMENHRPKFRLFDTEFIVDNACQEFQQADNPGNRIPFRDTLNNGDHIAMVYDKGNKNVFKGDCSTLTVQDGVFLVCLPARFDSGEGYYPAGIKLYPFVLPVEAKDFGQDNVKPLLRYPTILIDRTEFMADLKRGEFQEVGKPENRISFSELHPRWGGTLQFLYDPNTRNVFNKSQRELQLQPDIRHILLPPLAAIHPLMVKFSLASTMRQIEKAKQEHETQSPRTKRSKGKRP